MSLEVRWETFGRAGSCSWLWRGIVSGWMSPPSLSAHLTEWHFQKRTNLSRALTVAACLPEPRTCSPRWFVETCPQYWWFSVRTLPFYWSWERRRERPPRPAVLLTPSFPPLPFSLTLFPLCYPSSVPTPSGLSPCQVSSGFLMPLSCPMMIIVQTKVKMSPFLLGT